MHTVFVHIFVTTFIFEHLTGGFGAAAVLLRERLGHQGGHLTSQGPTTGHLQLWSVHYGS